MRLCIFVNGRHFSLHVIKSVSKMKSPTSRQYIYDKKWEEIFPITQVESEPHAYYCVPCERKYSCAHNGIRNVRAHCTSSTHIRKTQRQTSGTGASESVISVKSEPAVRRSPSESSPVDNNLNSSFRERNKSGNFTVQKKKDKMLVTSNKQNKEIKSKNNSTMDDFNVWEFLRKYKNAYRMNLDGEIDKDLGLTMDRNRDRILKAVNEEFAFLEIVLKKLINYKKIN
ncbi:hypothetical protein RF11_13051 [Thelohanellus kitauei]|uniref:Uncharacterized protein n=1 Tax=Thelohanellus kitauei TaxID=669202 RepID=A0A0C2N0C4_THEKT|nr:hypothetical protein RF11_13051 [Thelohanellus kitauei]